MKTRSLLKALGFREDPQALTDEQPGYYHDFGNLRLTACQGTNRHFVSVFLFGGVASDGRSIALIEFELPLETESFEQGVAFIAYGLGRDFKPLIEMPWLSDGWAWQHHLPWVRQRAAYEARPQCVVDRDWFRVALKKLREMGDEVAKDDLVWMTFDGEVLRFSVGGTPLIVPAAGTAWTSRYAIRGSQLNHLPKRLADPVRVSVWDGRFIIGNSAWELVHPGDEGEPA